MKQSAAFSKLAIVLLSSISLTACAGKANGVPEIKQSQFERPPEDIRDYRYCEIIPIYRSRLTFNIEVYNTINLNDCPTEKWMGLDQSEMKKSYNAMDIKMNGPRYWLMNKIEGEGATATGKIVDFGGIEMQLVAVIETKLWEGAVGGKFYSENEVQRETIYTYDEGAEVYELVSPAGETYRMQSYAQLVDKDLSIEDLRSLDQRLDLPEGWRYQTRILEDKEIMIAAGIAYVINDTFGNSYQKILN